MLVSLVLRWLPQTSRVANDGILRDAKKICNGKICLNVLLMVHFRSGGELVGKRNVKGTKNPFLKAFQLQFILRLHLRIAVELPLGESASIMAHF